MSFSPVVSEPTKIYVGGINYGTDEQTLKSQFGHCGNIQEVIIIRERETGKSKGYGFIKFDHEDSAKQAITSMNGAELDGRNIKVSKAQKPSRGGDGTFRGRGGYAGRGRGSYQGFSNGVGYSTSGAYGAGTSYGGWPSSGSGYSASGYSTGMPFGGQYDSFPQNQASSAGWPSSGSYGSYGSYNYSQGGY